MAPWIETRTTHLFGIPIRTTVKELKVGQRIKLGRGGTSMDVEILSGDEAKAGVVHKHLAVQIWTPHEDGTKSFEKDFIPFLAHSETAERKSIILENGNVTSAIEWRPIVPIVNDSTARLQNPGRPLASQKIL